jgi:phosphoribosylformylglycinamidine cyclo-ligase
MSKKLSYYSAVNYDLADPAKILAQQEGKATAKNMPLGFHEVEGTRGESAYVFDMGEQYGALVQEGLGTKSLIAQSIYNDTGVSHFAAVAQDTVGTFVNDLISVGAVPVVTNAYWSASSYDWLADKKLTTDFIKGWRAACDAAGVVWGGGETQSLSGIVQPGVLELAGCAFGVISPKTRLVSEKNLAVGDAIILIESNGVHANGISMTRQIADSLPKGYATKLPSGKSYGESLLRPSHLYAKAVDALFQAGLNVHYLSHITGHGWRKLMRATVEATYRLTFVPPVDELFMFIAQQSKNDDEEMYSNFNMGAGYAVFVPEKDAKKAVAAIKKSGLTSWVAGRVEKGPRQVIIEPKGITYSGERLGVRA